MCSTKLNWIQILSYWQHFSIYSETKKKFLAAPYNVFQLDGSTKDLCISKKAAKLITDGSLDKFMKNFNSISEQSTRLQQNWFHISESKRIFDKVETSFFQLFDTLPKVLKKDDARIVKFIEDFRQNYIELTRALRLNEYILLKEQVLQNNRIFNSRLIEKIKNCDSISDLNELLLNFKTYNDQIVHLCTNIFELEKMNYYLLISRLLHFGWWHHHKFVDKKLSLNLSDTPWTDETITILNNLYIDPDICFIDHFKFLSDEAIAFQLRGFEAFRELFLFQKTSISGLSDEKLMSCVAPLEKLRLSLQETQVDLGKIVHVCEKFNNISLSQAKLVESMNYFIGTKKQLFNITFWPDIFNVPSVNVVQHILSDPSVKNISFNDIKKIILCKKVTIPYPNSSIPFSDFNKFNQIITSSNNLVNNTSSKIDVVWPAFYDTYEQLCFYNEKFKMALIQHCCSIQLTPEKNNGIILDNINFEQIIPSPEKFNLIIEEINFTEVYIISFYKNPQEIHFLLMEALNQSLLLL